MYDPSRLLNSCVWDMSPDSNYYSSSRSDTGTSFTPSKPCKYSTFDLRSRNFLQFNNNRRLTALGCEGGSSFSPTKLHLYMKNRTFHLRFALSIFESPRSCHRLSSVRGAFLGLTKTFVLAPSACQSGSCTWRVAIPVFSFLCLSLSLFCIVIETCHDC